MACFDECGCVCFDGTAAAAFNDALTSELRTPLRLAEIVESHAGWYQDGEEGRLNGDIQALGPDNVSGVYILWRQAGYCEIHEAEHLVAEYVGKAGKSVSTRLLRHQLEKSVNEELTTEFSLWQCPNRVAKYLEQALLDHFHFPLNRAEMSGTRRLCQHISPAAWN